jgi:hypothetical protein
METSKKRAARVHGELSANLRGAAGEDEARARVQGERARRRPWEKQRPSGAREMEQREQARGRRRKSWAVSEST